MYGHLEMVRVCKSVVPKGKIINLHVLESVTSTITNLNFEKGNFPIVGPYLYLNKYA